MNTIKAYFKVCRASQPSDECHSEPSFVHVQQKTCDGAMWDLSPSAISDCRDPKSCNEPVSADQWNWSLVNCNFNEEENQCNSLTTTAAHSLLNELQEECPSFNIKQIYERYCLLRGRDTENVSQLICSIPVLAAQDRICVDGMAFPRGEGCLYSHPWTHVYSPTCSDQVIGNSSACAAIQQWLHCWKSKHSRQNGANCSQKKKHGDDCDPDYLPSHPPNSKLSSLQDEEVSHDDPSSALLLHGPHGSGKTTAVYACAAQEGFKVLEINAGSLRSRSQLLRKLKEVTLSQRVQTISWQSQKSISLCSNTVILFDEVDVVFEEDHGFLRTVQDIVTSTKCPIILTCKVPSLEFHDVSKIQFHIPTEMELAIHLSLLSLVNDWPLSLVESRQLCKHFNGDIRKTILHLQLMLSWQPTNPMISLTSKTSHSIPVSPSSCSLTLNNFMYYPWRTHSSAQHCQSGSHTPNYLDLISVLYDKKSEVDCIWHTSWEKADLHRPWQVTLQPSLLDERASVSSSCPVGRDIQDTLHHLLYADSPANNMQCDRFVAKEELLDKLVSNCRFNRSAVVTECIPYLKLMCSHEETRRQREQSRMRQSRHYFHPHHLDILVAINN